MDNDESTNAKQEKYCGSSCKVFLKGEE